MSNYITETYSLKYYGETMNYRRQRSRVEIWSKAPVDATYPRRIGDIRGLSLAINGNEDVAAPVVKTILNLSMADTWDEPQEAAADAVKHGVWDEFYTPDSTAYLVKLYTRSEGDESWTHRWSGYVTPDNWKEAINYRGDVGITARDNLGHLKDFTFDLPGDADGMVSVRDIITGALARIAFPMDVILGDSPAGDRATLQAADTGTELFDALVRVATLEGDDWGSVFEDILDSLGLTVRFVDNATVAITFIRNLPLFGAAGALPTQTIEFYGPGTRTLVPAWRDVVVSMDYGYERDVTFGARPEGAYGPGEMFDWSYYEERGHRTISGQALRCSAAQTSRGWFSGLKAFVNPDSYLIVNPRGGGGAALDPDTTALLIANATDESVRLTEAGFIFGRVWTPAGTVSLDVVASYTLSGRYLLRAGGLSGYEWSAVYTAQGKAWWWSGSRWSEGDPVWEETTDNRMDMSAPMNLQDIPENGILTVFVRNIKATAGFCVGVSGVTLSCVAPARSLDTDTVTVINNPSYNVKARRSPRLGFLSRPVPWNVPDNYPVIFWRRLSGGGLEPFPYQQLWSDGEERLGAPVQWAKQALMFHHSTLQQIEGEVGVTGGGSFSFGLPVNYKGHAFLPQGGALNLLTGHVTGISLREFIDYSVLWAGAASVAPTLVLFSQEGGQETVLVTAAEDKAWTVDGLPDWLEASPASGVGSGAVTLTAAANLSGFRSRTIYVAGVEVSARQGQMEFDLDVSPRYLSAVRDGQSFTLIVTASEGASWRLVPGDDWILVNGGDEYEGTGYRDNVYVYVQENETGSDRDTILTLYDGDDNPVATVNVHQFAGEESYPLTVTTNVDSPSIEVTVDGEAVAYTPGMIIGAGKTVSVTVSRDGYIPASGTFTMSASTTEMFFELYEDIPVTFSRPSPVSASAQDVTFVVSDPRGKGWGLDYDNADYLGYVDGAAVVSGNATKRGTEITGTGDAVFTLHITANSSTSAYRNIGGGTYPFWVKYSSSGGWQRGAELAISQMPASAPSVLVTAVSLDRAALSLGVGASATLTPTVSPSNATNKTLRWSSSDNSVATVSQNGRVTAVATGTATITATSTDGSNKSATCAVTVTGQTVRVTGVSLNRQTALVRIGGTVQLIPEVMPTNASDKSVTWSSSNTSVATVSSAGVVTGVASGSAVITVRTTDGGFTATCAVTVTASGTINVGNLSVSAVQTSASAEVTCSGMVVSTLTASENVSWITGASVDTSGTKPRVRLTLQANTGSSSRSATVTVSGRDESGNTVSASFTVTQRAPSSSDIPCQSMEIIGWYVIENFSNRAEYTIAFNPEATTENAVDWSLTDRDTGLAPSAAEILSYTDTSCVVRVNRYTGWQHLKLTATNRYNTSVVATWNINAHYQDGTGHLEIDPASVTVLSLASSDDSPVVTATNIVEGSLAVRSVGGFIREAVVDSRNRVVTSFSQNAPSTVPREGSVTLEAVDLEDNTVTAVINYLQLGWQPSAWGLDVTGLRVERNGNRVNMAFAVTYTNSGNTQAVATGQRWALLGLDSGGEVVFLKEGTLSDKTIASLSTESEVYTASWNGTTGAAVTYQLTLTSGDLEDTYTGDGNDPIIV